MSDDDEYEEEETTQEGASVPLNLNAPPQPLVQKPAFEQLEREWFSPTLWGPGHEYVKRRRAAVFAH